MGAIGSASVFTIVAIALAVSPVVPAPQVFLASLPIGLAAPQVFLIDGERLESLQARAKEKGRDDPAIRGVIADGERAMKTGRLTIVDKAKTPPSGDKHDFLTMGWYYWPDPSKPDGKPYIYKDGQVNPETSAYTDLTTLGTLLTNVGSLARTYYVLGDEKYADKAADLLRVFFIDRDTRMNPHLENALWQPGTRKGSASGIIQTRDFATFMDTLRLLEGSRAWAQVREGVRDWFARYLDWLINSPSGPLEASRKNNHGTWYDVQVTAIALYLGRTELAKRIVEESRTKRIAAQIEPDGRMPAEIERTRSLQYSVLNLQALFALARLARPLGVDLWNYETRDGRSIRKALDFVLPYAIGEKDWEHQQIVRWETADTKRIAKWLWQARDAYSHDIYHRAQEKLK